jgi:hypothetical protein
MPANPMSRVLSRGKMKEQVKRLQLDTAATASKQMVAQVLETIAFDLFQHAFKASKTLTVRIIGELT